MMASVGSQERYGDYFEAARQAGDLLNRKKRKQPKAETLSNYSLLPLEERLFRNVEGISSYDLPKMLVELINNGLTDQTFKIAETGRTERVVDVLLALTDRLDREKIERDRRIFGEIDFDPYGSPSTYGQYIAKSPLKRCICCGKTVPVAFHASQPWDATNQDNGRFCSTRCYVSHQAASKPADKQ